MRELADRLPTGDQDDARRRLRRMKRNATLLLVVAAAVYVVTVVATGWHGDGHGFVQTAAEAAMVGGLADWFAVTALFRRPLGLPIPHTGLIPRQKDALATKLGEFVTNWFLTPETLQAQLKEADVVGRVGAWLADPGHAGTVGREIAAVAANALDSVDADQVAEALLDMARREHDRRAWAPILGRLLDRAIEGQAERPLVDLLAARGAVYLATHGDELRPHLKKFIEDRNWVTWVITTDRLVRRLIQDLIHELDDIGHMPQHPVRVALEGWLRQVAVDLQSDEAPARELDRVAAGLLEDPRTAEIVRDLAQGGIGSLRASLTTDGGTAALRVQAMVTSLGHRLVDDRGFHDRLERGLEDLIGYGVSRYGQSLTHLIRRQVEAWPAADASRRIELAVGRDLQFIRINGTIVGALAGIAIHAVTLAIRS